MKDKNNNKIAETEKLSMYYTMLEALIVQQKKVVNSVPIHIGVINKTGCFEFLE